MGTNITTQSKKIGDREIPVHSVSTAATPTELKSVLGLGGYQHVILLFGSADNLDSQLEPAIRKILVQGLLPLAVAAQAVIIDGGTAAGMMKLLGEVMATNEIVTPLIGVAPESLIQYGDEPASGKVLLEPHHSQFVLVRGIADWGGETDVLFNVATGLVKDNSVKIIAILAGGGSVAIREIQTAVCRQIPVFVLTGTGGFADQLAVAKKADTPLTVGSAEEMVLGLGDLYFWPLEGNPSILKQAIEKELDTDRLLTSAWEDFANFDHSSGIQQNIHKWFQGLILWLGIAAGAMGILWQVYYSGITEKSKYTFWQWLLYGLLIIIPIVLTILIAAANKFKNGLKWIFFRAAAEAIKREIYTYRSRTGPYRTAPAVTLADRLSKILQKAMKTDVNHTYTRRYNQTKGFPPTGKSDDGYGRLSPELYLSFRLDDQISFYTGKVKEMNSTLSVYNWLIYLLAGCGTLLAVLEAQVWVALTTAMVAAIGSWLGYQQWDATISKYNQGITDLGDIKNWWNALDPEAKLQVANREQFVSRTEQTLQNEYDGWAQQMQQTLEEWNKQQQADQQKKEKGDK